ncbi:MAG: hypothetical protein M3388_10105 [Acidobacteriota bacterium]|nr:hypothetical protein [Acidobacteriota bacterium]
MLRKAIQILALTFLLATVFFGQEDTEPISNQDAIIPIKIDEFGLIGGCDLNARVHNFFIELNNNPSATGYIILYQGKNELPANQGLSSIEERIRNEIAFGRFDESRIVFVRGGFRDELANELYLVPNGAVAPEPTDTIPAPTMPKNKTFIYDNNILGSDDYYEFLEEFILSSVKAKMEEETRLAQEQARAKELTSEESIETEVETVEETFEIEKPTPEEIEEAKFSWANEKFGEVIKNQKDSSGVIIFYADDAHYDDGKLQNFIEEGKQKIAEVNKISIQKIQVVFGGYRDMVQAEFWVVPKKGEFPTPQPEERPIQETEN